MPMAEFRNRLDDRQTTHLISVRLKHLLYDFLGGGFWAVDIGKQQEGGPKHPPPPKSYSKCFRRTQIR